MVDFSRFRDIDVVASSATEAYGQKGAELRQIARDLNVRYVLIALKSRFVNGSSGRSLGGLNG